MANQEYLFTMLKPKLYECGGKLYNQSLFYSDATIGTTAIKIIRFKRAPIRELLKKYIPKKSLVNHEYAFTKIENNNGDRSGSFPTFPVYQRGGTEEFYRLEESSWFCFERLEFREGLNAEKKKRNGNRK